jgi:hypothetical protein
MKIENNCFSSLCGLLFQLLDRKSMFMALYSVINSLKSGLFHLTGQSNSQKGGKAKVKDGIVSETSLGNYFSWTIQVFLGKAWSTLVSPWYSRQGTQSTPMLKSGNYKCLLCSPTPIILRSQMLKSGNCRIFLLKPRFNYCVNQIYQLKYSKATLLIRQQ